MAPPLRDNSRGKGTVMDWTRILAYVTRTVVQELLARNEYLAAENRILKALLNGRLKLSEAERAMLGKIGHRLGRQALAEVATGAAGSTSPASPFTRTSFSFLTLRDWPRATSILLIVAR
jgi:hypothetical protein